MVRLCSLEGCEGKHKGLGYCDKHYQCFKKHGDPLYINPQIIRMCSVEGCESVYDSKGYCGFHYKRWRIHGDPLVSKINRCHDPICTVEDCESKYYCKGFCVKHHARFKRHGDPLYETPKYPEICTVNGCNKKYKGCGYCPKHNYTFKKYGDPLYKKSKIVIICSIGDCNNNVISRGFCHKHYKRWQVYDDPNNSGNVKPSKPERFLESIISINTFKYERQKKILGTPDFFIEPNICIFEDGCYYHGCKKHNSKKTLLTEIPQTSLKRDKFVNRTLKDQGYKVIRIWEHDVLNNPTKCIKKIRGVI